MEAATLLEKTERGRKAKNVRIIPHPEHFVLTTSDAGVEVAEPLPPHFGAYGEPSARDMHNGRVDNVLAHDDRVRWVRDIVPVPIPVRNGADVPGRADGGRVCPFGLVPVGLEDLWRVCSVSDDSG